MVSLYLSYQLMMTSLSVQYRRRVQNLSINLYVLAWLVNLCSLRRSVFLMQPRKPKLLGLLSKKCFLMRKVGSLWLHKYMTTLSTDLKFSKQIQSLKYSYHSPYCWSIRVKVIFHWTLYFNNYFLNWLNICLWFGEFKRLIPTTTRQRLNKKHEVNSGRKRNI